MSKVLLHIGLHKTGTTYLQRNYFPSLKEINYFGGYHFFTLFSLKELAGKTLISKEVLSGLPWNEEWKRGLPNDFYWIDSFKLSVKNLSIVFPDAHIIIVLRKHGDLLVSLYKQYIQEGGLLPLNKFYADDGVIRTKDLSFVERIEFLKANFSKVDVLSFEKFKMEGDSYFDKYFMSLGIEREIESSVRQKGNKSISGKKVELLRRYNKVYLYQTPLFLKRGISFLGLAPRKFVQEKLNFWKSEDTKSLKMFKERLNLKFKKDWDSIEFKKL